MMVPIQVIRWYRMQCYDGTDSCAIVVPIRRYCHVSFHPDDDFADYVYFADKTPVFNEQEVMLYNRLMDESFDACEKANADIYSICYDEMMAELKRMIAC